MLLCKLHRRPSSQPCRADAAKRLLLLQLVDEALRDARDDDDDDDCDDAGDDSRVVGDETQVHGDPSFQTRRFRACATTCIPYNAHSSANAVPAQAGGAREIERKRIVIPGRKGSLRFAAKARAPCPAEVSTLGPHRAPAFIIDASDKPLSAFGQVRKKSCAFSRKPIDHVGYSPYNYERYLI